ncbi:MAG TPA: BTAD domain-containing putative transcriptional regulator [Thermoleophilaceae bacterium]|nr:BTAD domain-containing putative transcriptional regulator [Thermoleophilaceae bacterium]
MIGAAGELAPAAPRPAAAPVRRRVQNRTGLDAFDLFPRAVMVCDSHGRVVAANARLRTELGTAPGGQATCCSLLGCGRPGTELEQRCVTAEALAAGEELDELCVELPAGRLRVSAAPLHGDRNHVAIELRPERRQPRSQPSLRIFTLGQLRVETPDGPIAADWLDQRAGQLLCYLACERRRIAPADAIAEAIWPQAGPAAANSVRHFVHVLRQRLEPDRPRNAQSSYVICRRGGYALASGRVWVDADEFESEAARGIAACAEGDAATAEERLARAAHLYEGDFLAEDPYAEWALAERERLRRTACDVLRALADIRPDGSEAAAACLEQLAAMEPFDNDVQRRLISTWLRLGRRSRAARHYEAFRWRLMRDFGERPGFDLAELRVG